MVSNGGIGLSHENFDLESMDGDFVQNSGNETRVEHSLEAPNDDIDVDIFDGETEIVQNLQEQGVNNTIPIPVPRKRSSMTIDENQKSSTREKPIPAPRPKSTLTSSSIPISSARNRDGPIPAPRKPATTDTYKSLYDTIHYDAPVPEGDPFLPAPENDMFGDEETHLKGDIFASNSPSTSFEQKRANSFIRRENEKEYAPDVSFDGSQFDNLIQELCSNENSERSTPMIRSTSATSLDSLIDTTNESEVEHSDFYPNAYLNLDCANDPRISEESQNIIDHCSLDRDEYDARKPDIIGCLKGFELLATKGEINIPAMTHLTKKLKRSLHRPAYYLKNQDPVYSYSSNRDIDGQYLLETWFPQLKQDYVPLEVCKTNDPVLSLVCTSLTGSIERIHEMRLATIRAMVKYNSLIQNKGKFMGWDLYDQPDANTPFDYWQEVSRCSRPGEVLGLHARFALSIAMNVKVHLLYPRVDGETDATFDYLHGTFVRDDWKHLRLKEINGLWTSNSETKGDSRKKFVANHCSLLARNVSKLEVPPVPKNIANGPKYKHYGFGVEEVDKVFKLFSEPCIEDEVVDEMPRGPKSNCQFVLKHFNKTKWTAKSKFNNPDCKYKTNHIVPKISISFIQI